MEGAGRLSQANLCVEWESNDNFAISCQLEEEEEEEERKTYSLVRCEELAEVQCPNTAVTQLGE